MTYNTAIFNAADDFIRDLKKVAANLMVNPSDGNKSSTVSSFLKIIIINFCLIIYFPVMIFWKDSNSEKFGSIPLKLMILLIFFANPKSTFFLFFSIVYLEFQASIYGLAASIPDKSLVSDVAYMYLDSCYEMPFSE